MERGEHTFIPNETPKPKEMTESRKIAKGLDGALDAIHELAPHGVVQSDTELPGILERRKVGETIHMARKKKEVDEFGDDTDKLAIKVTKIDDDSFRIELVPNPSFGEMAA